MNSIDIARRAREIFDYDETTGIFRWKVRRNGPSSGIGGIASNLVKKTGYHRIMVDGARFQAHRVAWLYVHGEWPCGVIDHINGDRADNRIANLRDATNSVNTQNTKRARNNNSSGVLGVKRRHNGTYGARIQLNGNQIWLGTFPSSTEAFHAYVTAKRQLHEGCTL